MSATVRAAATGVFQRLLEESADALAEKARVAEEEAALLKTKASEVERENQRVQLAAIKVSQRGGAREPAGPARRHQGRPARWSARTSASSSPPSR